MFCIIVETKDKIMSNYINQILKDIEHDPTSFRDYQGCGIEKGNIVISQYGNTRLLSIIDVHINGKRIPTSYIDKWRLETAIKNWYETIPLWVLTERC